MHSVNTRSTSIHPFDTRALYWALDARRAELGLSWSRVAKQIWEMSSELNDRRQDHPISASTLTNLREGPGTTCQHALFILRWLGRTPESFLGGPPAVSGPRFALPEVVPDRRLRWRLKWVYGAMDEQRRAQGLTWSSLASVLGCSPNQLTALRTAKFATDMDLAMRIVQWLDRPAADFVYPARWCSVVRPLGRVRGPNSSTFASLPVLTAH